MSDAPRIPYTQHTITHDDAWAVGRALHSAALTQGAEVERFEADLCAVTGARYAVAVSSGTAALHCLYTAAKAREPGVRAPFLVPSVSFVATANAAHLAGWLVDFEDATPLDLPRLDVWASIGGDVPERMPAPLLDLAHALGAPVDFTAIVGAAYSFHPAKHVTTGEGGAVCTNDADVARCCRLFRAHGRDGTRQVQFGFNYRLPDLNAALGRAQLARLAWSIARRREIAARYDEAFQGLRLTPVPHSPRSARHLYQILVADRDAVAERLNGRGIGTAVHYPVIPLQPWWQARGGYTAAQFPLATAWAARTLSLPLYPTLTDADVRRVITAVQEECR